MKCASFLIVMFLLVMAACRKDAVPPAAVVDLGQGTGHCRLSHVAQHKLFRNRLNTGHLYFSYDSAGRLLRVVNINAPDLTLYGTSTNFKYSGDTIYAIHEPKVVGDDIIILNQRRQIALVGVIGYPDQDVFTYDQAGQLTSEILNTGTMPGTYYTWAGGDVIKDSSRTGSNVAHHIYYEGRLFQYGSPDVLEFYATWGVPLVKTKHIEKSLDGSWGRITTYTFDAEGKMTSDTVKSMNGVISYYNTFEYECL